MTTAISQHDQSRRRPPALTSAAAVSVLTVAVVAGIALQHHTPGEASRVAPDPPVASYPGSAVFDNQPAVPDPPVASYPGSAVFDNQPAAPWWRPRDDLRRLDRSR